jgi:uncharacterized membrane protein YsdA (DUF1294 family)
MPAAKTPSTRSLSAWARGWSSLREAGLRAGAFVSGVWWLFAIGVLIASQTQAMHVSWWAIAGLVLSLLMSGGTWFWYAYDKHCAQHDFQRVPESRLLMLTLLGGWAGAFLAQRWLRHKSQHLSFQLAAWLGLGLHLGVLALWWWWG